MKSTTIAARILLALGAASYAVACASDESDTSTTSAQSATASSTRGATTTTVGSGGIGGAGGIAEGGMGGMGEGGLGGLPCPRRPFLVASVPRAGSIRERDDWDRRLPHGVAELDPSTRAALAGAWLEDARQEHASIAAFGRFTMLLAAVGAPPELIMASQRAGMDEVAHARACFALAARYSGVSHGPGEVCLDGALAGTVLLSDVAALAVHEGCVGETLGVLLASHQLEGATDPAVRAVLKRLVRDEMRHAELAWRFAKWAIEHGGDAVREAVVTALDDARAETLRLRYPEDGPIDARVWRAHGRLRAAEMQAYVARGLDALIEPCARALLATSMNGRLYTGAA